MLADSYTGPPIWRYPQRHQNGGRRPVDAPGGLVDLDSTTELLAILVGFGQVSPLPAKGPRRGTLGADWSVTW